MLGRGLCGAQTVQFHRACGERAFALSLTPRNRPKPWGSTALDLETLGQSTFGVRILLPSLLCHPLSYVSSLSQII